MRRSKPWTSDYGVDLSLHHPILFSASARLDWRYVVFNLRLLTDVDDLFLLLLSFYSKLPS
jgi:hypothetical protein